MRLSILAILLSMLGTACVGKSEPVSHMEPPPKPVEAPARPQFVVAAAGNAADAVRHALGEAGDQKLIVYVGAAWCEPCTRFHEALEAGQLDDALAGVRFVEFDADRDRDRLPAGGYDGELIPRFVVPRPDGNGSERRLEGGVKGEAAVEHIMGRLAPLLAEH